MIYLRKIVFASFDDLDPRGSHRNFVGRAGYLKLTNFKPFFDNFPIKKMITPKNIITTDAFLKR